MNDCCGGPKLIYTCSGAADVGEVADRIGRKLARLGFGKMTCLAAIGADLSGFVESAKTAENIVIDGCSVACGRKNLERIGAPSKVFILTEMGLRKGESPATETVVEAMMKEITEGITAVAGDPGQSCKGNCGCA